MDIEFYVYILLHDLLTQVDIWGCPHPCTKERENRNIFAYSTGGLRLIKVHYIKYFRPRKIRFKRFQICPSQNWRTFQQPFSVVTPLKSYGIAGVSQAGKIRTTVISGQQRFHWPVLSAKTAILYVPVLATSSTKLPQQSSFQTVWGPHTHHQGQVLPPQPSLLVRLWEHPVWL